jgi:hypothetical protein
MVLIVLLMCVGFTSATASLISFVTPIDREPPKYGRPWGPARPITLKDGVVKVFLASRNYMMPPFYIPRTPGQICDANDVIISRMAFSLGGFDVDISTIFGPCDAEASDFARLWLPLWIPFVLSVPYPALVFIRGPLRRRRRLRKGLCTKCGYDLTGNVSGVCPECGQRCGPHLVD